MNDMTMEKTFDFIQTANDILISLIVFALGVGLVIVAVLYVVDVTQTKQAVRRNFPVVGRFRYLF